MVKLGIRMLQAVTILMVALYAVVSFIPWQVPTLFVAVQVLLLRLYGKERGRDLSMVYRFEASLRTYARMLELLENQKFNAPWLSVRQGRLRNAAGRSAFEQIHRLSTIVERIHFVGHHYFFNITGSGFDAAVSNTVHTAWYKKLGGTLPYISAVLQTLVTYRPQPMTVQIDGQSYSRKALLVSIGNTQFTGGGMMMLPDAICDDGLLDVVIAGDVTKSETNVDGDISGELAATFEVVPGALLVVTP